MDLNHTELSDLKPLGVLTGLQSLNLDRTKITDAGLAHLSGCTKLIILERDGTKMTEAGKKRFFDAIKRK